MCGISGIISNVSVDYTKKITSMINSQNHRGPDAHNFVIINFNSYSILLGHNRLSIIDLSSNGNQPQSYKDSYIVFNGEIYNYLSIKDQLVILGHIFISTSDTEVILHAFDQWGISCLEKFQGIFSMAIFSLKDESIYLIRDRVGVKPLFYCHIGNELIFASELKAIHKFHNGNLSLNMNALIQFFQIGYITESQSIYNNVFKLEPGSFLKFNLKNGQKEKSTYWTPLTSALIKPDLSYEEAQDKIEKLLTEGINLRMVSDVPIGVFLSGGIDSSLVTAILQKNSMKKIKTFTIGFNEKAHDEAPYAKEIAKYLGTDHEELYCDLNLNPNLLNDLPNVFDEPFGDTSAIPTMLISQTASQFVKVVLSADGGDELFAGYNHYANIIRKYNFLKKIENPIVRGLLNLINTNISSSSPTNLNLLKQHYKLQLVKTILKNGGPNIEDLWRAYMNDSFLTLNQNFFLHTLSFQHSVKNMNSFPFTQDKLNALLYFDFKHYLPDDVLVKVDRATMAYSIEGREPLLHHPLIEFVFSLSGDFKYRKNLTKFPLKKIAYKYIPEKLLNRPKKGFAMPILSFYDSEIRILINKYLAKSRIESQGLFNYETIHNSVNIFNSGNQSSFDFIWRNVTFQMWFERWMK
jgi:asparagine synthase (glutamine-hydrolysing)